MPRTRPRKRSSERKSEAALVRLTSTAEDALSNSVTGMTEEGSVQRPLAMTSTRGTSLETDPDEDYLDTDEGGDSQATPAGLAAMVLRGRLQVEFSLIVKMFPLIWIFISGWLMIQDNADGRLDTPEGFVWLGNKAAIVASVLLAIAIAWGALRMSQRIGDSINTGMIVRRIRKK